MRLIDQVVETAGLDQMYPRDHLGVVEKAFEAMKMYEMAGVDDSVSRHQRCRCRRIARRS